MLVFVCFVSINRIHNRFFALGSHLVVCYELRNRQIELASPLWVRSHKSAAVVFLLIDMGVFSEITRCLGRERINSQHNEDAFLKVFKLNFILAMRHHQRIN